jgi:hypothetical protein
MSWRRRREPAGQRPPAAAQSAATIPGSELGDDELQFCCICGACNRTRNFDIEMGC